MNVNLHGGGAPSSTSAAGSGILPPISGTGCATCGLDQNANQILLCDGCDAEYHTYCLVPPLKEIPEGDFYCKSCKDAKKHVKAPSAAAPTNATGMAATSVGASTTSAAATQAGFAVQDENGRMVPIRPEDVREVKYKGVLKLLQKGAKKPFVARIHKDNKYVQIGLYSSEIEAAHAFDKMAIQVFGHGAQLNFPHLHDGFIRAGSAASAATATTTSTSSNTYMSGGHVASSSAAMASPALSTPGRGRGRGRGGRGAGRGGRGGAAGESGGGRGKRRLEDDSPSREAGGNANGAAAVKRRKALALAMNLPVANGPKLLGVTVFRGYAHAQIVVNGKAVILGTFPTAVDAGYAYDKAALKYFGGEIGSPTAVHDRVVLNFPAKRADYLKQLIEESMHQLARQGNSSLVGAGGHVATASGASSSSSFNANRSMQSAKHNLSIKKLETWLLKLQRSVKLVEAAHRVQWNGLPLVKPEETPADSVETDEDQNGLRDIKLELLAGAGPMIKTDFTKKQQRLRASASQIQDAVNLMLEELKIYASDTPVDAAFHPAPRSHVLLDLLSTTRFLKLCSTINELAHFNATTAEAGRQPQHVDDEEPSLEALLQTVVDYRTRLQMATSSEKQKLMGLVDSDAPVGSTTTGGGDAAANEATGVTSEVATMSRELLRRAKYVKRKVQRIRKVTKIVPVIEAAAVEAESKAKPDEKKEEEEERKEAEKEPVALSVEQASTVAAVSSEEEKASGTTEAMEVDDDSTSAAVDGGKKEETDRPAPVVDGAGAAGDVIQEEEDGSAPTVEAGSEPVVSVVADDAITNTTTNESSGEKKEETSEDATKDDDAHVEVPAVPRSSDAEVAAGAPASTPKSEAVAETTTSALQTDDGDHEMADMTDTPEATASDATTAPTTDTAPPPAGASEVVEEETEIVEEVWEFCLAVKSLTPTSRTNASTSDGTTSTATTTDKDELLWRLVPLESVSGEFVADVLLTDDQVAAMEVTEADVCGEHGGKPRLAVLHQHEHTLRDQVQSETEKRHALEGVIKIEQERLSQVFVVYRRTLEGIMAKSSDVQKNHQRISRDLLLVKLMKQTFAPILDDLLTQCESVFLGRLEKMADRFEDFQQEFDYYTDALLSVVGTLEKPVMANGRMKDGGDEQYQAPEEEEAEPQLALVADDNDDESTSTSLRSAYVSFYMEEIEALWKERCRAVESLLAILRSLTTGIVPTPPGREEQEGEDTVAAPDAAAAALVDVSGSVLLRRRVQENLDQWKGVHWPMQLATPSFVSSFMAENSHCSANVAALLPAVTGTATTTNGWLKKEQHGNNVATRASSAMSELKQIIIDLTQENPTTIAPTPRVAAPRHSTLVVYHPVFLDHQTPKDHPECPERLNRIITMLSTLRKKFDDAVKIDRLTQTPDELAPSESILLSVHSPAYLDQLKTRAIEASAPTTIGIRGPVSQVPSTALVFETNRGAVNLSAKDASSAATRASPTGSMGGAFGAANTKPTGIAMDTYVSSKSWDVARAAAGTVCLAVDRVVQKEFRNAACLVRPPGHHVGRHGRTLDAPSSGFCLLNNVVIGAVHARQYPWIRRVAVLDWDIHHGNGTEELMRDDADGFFASIHLYASGKFFPGTGKSEQHDNLVNVALENTGAGSGSAVFRSALQDQILPAMRAFRPDIIFISAGFDGHKDDILGGRAAVKNTAVPAGYLEEDYAWATQEVLKLADECCDGRVISVLEGGYDVRKETNSLAKSVAAHVSAIASYEQDKQKQRQQANGDATAASDAADDTVVAIKSDRDGGAEAGGVLSSLLAKNINDGDVVIIDDDDNDDQDAEEIDDGDDDDVEEEDGHVDHDDVVMTDEDVEAEGDHVDDDDDGEDEEDNHSAADLAFAASLSVDGDDHEDHDGHDEDHDHGSRIHTPEYDGIDGTGGGGGDDGDDDMMGNHRNEDDDDEEEEDEGEGGGDLLDDEDELPLNGV